MFSGVNRCPAAVYTSPDPAPARVSLEESLTSALPPLVATATPVQLEGRGLGGGEDEGQAEGQNN